VATPGTPHAWRRCFSRGATVPVAALTWVIGPSLPGLLIRMITTMLAWPFGSRRTGSTTLGTRRTGSGIGSGAGVTGWARSDLPDVTEPARRGRTEPRWLSARGAIGAP